jgi:hypothetical protein
MPLVPPMITATFPVKSNGFSGCLDMNAPTKMDAAEYVRFQCLIPKSDCVVHQETCPTQNIESEALA